MAQKKTIQVSSFLLMHCDLRRKRIGISQRPVHRSHVKITRECSIKLHILQMYRLGSLGVSLEISSF